MPRTAHRQMHLVWITVDNAPNKPQEAAFGKGKRKNTNGLRLAHPDAAGPVAWGAGCVGKSGPGRIKRILFTEAPRSGLSY